MAQGTLRTWLSLSAAAAVGLSLVSALTLSADETATPSATQTKALASLTAPALPGTYGVAQHDGPVTPPANDTCAEDLDTYIQPLAVTFAQGSTVIADQNTSMLSHIAALVIACEDAHMQVAGHADGSGDDRTNIALSWHRADETLTALVRLGVDPAQLEAIGYGARAPLAQGSDDGSAANRRVDFRVLRRRD